MSLFPLHAFNFTYVHWQWTCTLTTGTENKGSCTARVKGLKQKVHICSQRQRNAQIKIKQRVHNGHFSFQYFSKCHQFSFHRLWIHPYVAHYGHVTVLCPVQHCPGAHQRHSHLHVPHHILPRLLHQRLFHAAPLDCLDSYRLISEKSERDLVRDITRDIELGNFNL